ncbi:hypothetical protein [Actinoplanes sp. DH11]|uniref:hypothetical protein n=1 Tax=Actinoplanes sp. DH11 TaxID=2857011 RepID=UPI001E32C5EA|nr:hypothetical protein [Actinoplanes sp. DH11]
MTAPEQPPATPFTLVGGGSDLTCEGDVCMVPPAAATEPAAAVEPAPEPAPEPVPEV